MNLKNMKERNGLHVMTALNGEGYRLSFLSLLIGDVRKMFGITADFKKQRIASHGPTQEHESATPDTLAGSTIQGDASDPGVTSVATTTKHPRHRPGCSCIACIQPPSGKGKHKPMCTCNVCMTVKRRFKNLMMRKKKCQREEEIAQRNLFIWGSKEEVEVGSTSRQVTSHVDLLESEVGLGCGLQSIDQNNQSKKVTDTNQEGLDLNCRPYHGEDLPIGSTRVSMMILLQAANQPLETYLKQNVLTSLISEQQASSGSHALPQATSESGTASSRRSSFCTSGSRPGERA